ncbi:MAG: LysR family transcriptional regulator [Variibacter sp.]|nr:LysR family transcriptional regulator [Variibacter sp.]
MATKGDRLQLMRLFVRVAEAGSLSAAGRLLGVSQPSTSRQLRQLEDMLGVQLIRRSSSQFILTDAGEQFLAAANSMLASWDAAAEAVRLKRDGLSGPIRIAAPVAAGQTVLAKIAAQFVAANPGVTMDWRLIDEPGDLAAGGYDLWIRAGPIRDQSLIVRDLWRAERTIVAAPAHPAVSHPAELEPHAAVQLVTYVLREIALESDDGQTMILRLKPSFATDNIFAALVAVREGVGYGILPHWVVQADLAAGTIVELCPRWRPPAVILSVAYPQARFRPARVKGFFEFLRERLLQTGADVLPRDRSGRPV